MRLPRVWNPRKRLCISVAARCSRADRWSPARRAASCAAWAFRSASISAFTRCLCVPGGPTVRVYIPSALTFTVQTGDGHSQLSAPAKPYCRAQSEPAWLNAEAGAMRSTCAPRSPALCPINTASDVNVWISRRSRAAVLSFASASVD